MDIDASEATGAGSRTVGATWARATRRVRQLVCGLHGHDALLHVEADRLSLACTSCGYQTPGWNLQAPPARVARRRATVTVGPVRERRAA